MKGPFLQINPHQITISDRHLIPKRPISQRHLKGWTIHEQFNGAPSFQQTDIRSPNHRKIREIVVSDQFITLLVSPLIRKAGMLVPRRT